MKEMLEHMWCKYNLLESFNRNMLLCGYTKNELVYITAQLDILKELIKSPTKILLAQLLKEQTNFRLKDIMQGEQNLLDIMNYPEGFMLNHIDDDKDAWRSKNSLIFIAANRKTYAFNSINNISTGQKHIEGKWQNI